MAIRPGEGVFFFLGTFECNFTFHVCINTYALIEVIDEGEGLNTAFITFLDVFVLEWRCNFDEGPVPSFTLRPK